MDEWSKATYGSPCRECGYSWSLTVEETIQLVGSLPTEYRDAVGDASGSERLPDLAWPVAAYICHVADNLRIWAERLQGVIQGRTRDVRAYDENWLAEVRGYEAIDLRAALWSLTRSCEDWIVTVMEALGQEQADHPVALVHRERREQNLVEVVRANCHDAVHHRWDVGRILGQR